MEQLRRIRKDRGLSQAKLAARAGIDPSTVNQIENGARKPSTATLERLAEALDVEMAELFRGYEVPKAQTPLWSEGAPERRAEGIAAAVDRVLTKLADDVFHEVADQCHPDVAEATAERIAGARVLLLDICGRL